MGLGQRRRLSDDGFAALAEPLAESVWIEPYRLGQLSTTGSRFARPGNLGYGTTCDAAAFLASDRAGAITGSVVDLSCGSAIRALQFGQARIGVLD
jgi:3D (Asp-Asp-Asp) domain-containing protein